METIIPAHEQKTTHSYVIRYPPHEPRQDDPHYRQFKAFRKAHIVNAKCWYGEQIEDFSKCNGVLELHHSVVEDAILNSVDPHLMDKYFPEAGATQDSIDSWAQSSNQSLIFLCEKHHRSGSGVHTVDYATWKGALVAPHILP